MFLEIFSWFRSTDTHKGTKKRSRRALGVEKFEDRALCAIDVVNGVLRINGDATVDHVVVAQTATQYRVTFDGAISIYAKAGISRIESNLGAGNDTYSGIGVTIPQHIWGGDGSDAITGGAAADTLYGGNGFDVLKGQNGNDILFGDAGVDWLVGGPGSDTYNAAGDNVPDRLIGVTASDTVNRDDLNVAALEVLDDHSNALNIFGETIEMIAQPGDDTLYRLKINGVDKGLRRAAGVVTIFADSTFTISPTLRTTLESRGLLRIEQLG